MAILTLNVTAAKNTACSTFSSLAAAVSLMRFRSKDAGLVKINLFMSEVFPVPVNPAIFTHITKKELVKGFPAP